MKLLPDQELRIRILKILLLLSACGWGISSAGLVLPWEYSSAILTSLGLEDVPDSPMFIYWFKMTAGAFTLIGVMFLLLALNPLKYQKLVSIAAVSMILEGGILLWNGLLLNLSLFPFYADVVFSLGGGVAILILNVSLIHREIA